MEESLGKVFLYEKKTKMQGVGPLDWLGWKAELRVPPLGWGEQPFRLCLRHMLSHESDIDRPEIKVL